MFPETIRQSAGRVIHALINSGMTIATAESCTGGLIIGALTEIPGSSDAVYGGFITYANAAKSGMIGVPEATIAQYGAVSSQVARAMAEGARKTAMVDIAIAVTGIAGPGGGSDDKPVGLVHLACSTTAGVSLIERRFGDLGRQQIRAVTVRAALELTLACILPQNGD